MMLPLLLLLSTGCDPKEDTAAFTCDRDPPLSYENYGSSFIATHCEGCHSVFVPTDLREDAPPGVDLNTYSDVLAWADRIDARASTTESGMPPGGGPSEDERVLLREWLHCSVYPDVERLAEE
ncbi:MAG: hypothetical protein ACI8S6_005972 [Myxococcota bacterium]|jgi:hypothetical protein